MSFNPDFFGPSLWRTMHIMAASATTKRKRYLYIRWLHDLEENLPCENCRIHYIDNLKNDIQKGPLKALFYIKKPNKTNLVRLRRRIV